jgi:hypothetical protein
MAPRTQAQRDRDRATAYGQYQPWGDAVDVREHLATLRDLGASWRVIAEAAGTGASTLHAIARGGNVKTTTADAILAVKPADLQLPREPAQGITYRLRALEAMGHCAERLAAATGYTAEHVRNVVHGRLETVEPEFAAAARAVYDAWWDKTPPIRDQYAQSAATAARERAKAEDWCTGAGLDEGLIDTPGYQPACSYREAKGTGIAPEITPPERSRRTVDKSEEAMAVRNSVSLPDGWAVLDPTQVETVRQALDDGEEYETEVLDGHCAGCTPELGERCDEHAAGSTWRQEYRHLRDELHPGKHREPEAEAG